MPEIVEMSDFIVHKDKITLSVDVAFEIARGFYRDGAQNASS